jgi:hypothetical protein
MGTTEAKEEKPGCRKLACMTAATVLLGLGICLAILEIALRTFYPQPLGISYSEAASAPVHTPNFPSHMVTAEFDVRTTFNSMGLRDRDYSLEKPQGTHRILVLGDSITEALQVQDEQVYTEILEASLNAKSSATNYEVINAAISGFGTGDMLAMLVDTGLRLEPDEVFLQMSLVNDVSENLYCRWYRVDQGEVVRKQVQPASSGARILEALARHSHLAQLFRHATRVVFGETSQRNQDIAQHKQRYHSLIYRNEGTEEDFQADWEVTFAFLREIDRILGERGIPFWVVVRGLEPDILGERDNRYPRSILFDFFEREGIDYLDLTPVFAERSGGDMVKYRFRIDTHWNPQGHRWAAEAIWGKMGERGMRAQ